MKKLILLIFLIISIFFSSNLFAQLTPEQIQSETDSLRVILKQLKAEMTSLKTEMDSLKVFSMSMDSKVDSVRTKAYIKKYGQKFGMQIASKQIWVGMTEEMMYDSWGKPDKMDKNKEAWGTFSQWYYGTVAYFFKNGKLTEWEEKN